MTKQEHKDILNQLLTADKQIDRVNLLTSLEQDYGTTLDEFEKIKTSNEALTKENGDYAKINNELFLRVSAQPSVINNKQSVIDNAGNSNSNEEPPAKLSYDALKFD